jgi:hypothetical protein
MGAWYDDFRMSVMQHPRLAHKREWPQSRCAQVAGIPEGQDGPGYKVRSAIVALHGSGKFLRAFWGSSGLAVGVADTRKFPFKNSPMPMLGTEVE